jgi:hypothetical protein
MLLPFAGLSLLSHRDRSSRGNSALGVRANYVAVDVPSADEDGLVLIACSTVDDVAFLELTADERTAGAGGVVLTA